MTEIEVISKPSHFLQLLRDGVTVYVDDMLFRGRRHYEKELYYPTKMRNIVIDRAYLCSYKGCKNKAIQNYCKDHFMFERPYG